MNNADMPAMPITIAPSSDVIAQAKGAGMSLPRTTYHHGLTKREHFAAMFMASLLPHTPNVSHDELSGKCIEAANALLAAFNNDKVAS